MTKHTEEFEPRARWIDRQLKGTMSLASEHQILGFISSELKEAYDQGYDQAILDNTKIYKE